MKKSYVSHSDLSKAPATDFEKIGKVTTDAVFKHTGKYWKQWVAVLEKAGAGTWTYQEIVAYLKKKHRLTPWWQHGVALGFEVAVGRRKAGQDSKGKYMVTATKSLSASPREIWKVLLSQEGQTVWLNPLSEIEIAPGTQFETSDGFFGEIRTVTKGRRIRLQWQDPLWTKPTIVEVLIVARPGKKTILVINHTELGDEKTKASLGRRWRDVVGRMPALLGEES
jgi:uncharacterized protein YndB with AHSA1/START domain